MFVTRPTSDSGGDVFGFKLIHSPSVDAKIAIRFEQPMITDCFRTSAQLRKLDGVSKPIGRCWRPARVNLLYPAITGNIILNFASTGDNARILNG